MLLALTPEELGTYGPPIAFVLGVLLYFLWPRRATKEESDE